MTGMVKEEILTRQNELGWRIEQGQVVFDFLLLDQGELLRDATSLVYQNVNGAQEQLPLPANALAFTICQVPVIMYVSDESYVDIHLSDGSVRRQNSFSL